MSDNSVTLDFTPPFHLEIRAFGDSDYSLIDSPDNLNALEDVYDFIDYEWAMPEGIPVRIVDSLGNIAAELIEPTECLEIDITEPPADWLNEIAEVYGLTDNPIFADACRAWLEKYG